MRILENNFLKISIDEHGAELHSLRSKISGNEYLWSGDAAYWKYHAPFLFPFVGRCRDNTFRIAGKTYELPQHGFARLLDFEYLGSTADSMSFILKSSEKTRPVYPYEFAFCIDYLLQKNTLTVSMTAKNTDNQPIYFSFGAHPAFRCPFNDHEEFADYYLEFSTRETADIYPVTRDGCLQRGKKKFLKDAVILPLTTDLFEKDALVFDELLSSSITLRSRKSSNSLIFGFHNFPYFGIWSPSKGAPFICLEPWLGHADFEDFTGDFRDKDNIIKLLPAQEITRSFSISIEEPSQTV